MSAIPVAAPALPPQMIAARVAGIAQETSDTYTLTLEAAGEGPALPAFQPGQFSMLYVCGVGEMPISISGGSVEGGRHVYTVRSVGKATHALVHSAKGAMVGVRGPFGTAWPLEEARGKDVIVAAGGIGLAPLRGAIEQILRNRSDYGHLVVLYGARSPRDLLYRKQLAEWGRKKKVEVLVTVDYAGEKWRGNVGVVTTLFRYVRLNPEGTVAMICGPEIMMRYVVRELARRAVPDEAIYLSMERNMKCALGFCGHCQLGPYFVCKDGPVFPYTAMRPWLDKHEA
jgi:NAD(P)H-flavin reductase